MVVDKKNPAMGFYLFLSLHYYLPVGYAADHYHTDL